MINEFNYKCNILILVRSINTFNVNEKDNRIMLIDLVTGGEQILMSIIFLHRNIHIGTWKSPNDLQVNQVIHILMNDKFKNNIGDVKMEIRANADSDHFLVVAKISILFSLLHEEKKLIIL